MDTAGVLKHQKQERKYLVAEFCFTLLGRTASIGWFRIQCPQPPPPLFHPDTRKFMICVKVPPCVHLYTFSLTDRAPGATDCSLLICVGLVRDTAWVLSKHIYLVTDAFIL